MTPHTWAESLLLTFVPLFVVIDAVGNLPFVVSLSEGMTGQERWKLINYAALAATLVGLVFLFLGQLILKALGISVGAFAIAGGIILLVLSINYMSSGRLVEVVKEEMVAIVPIGTPLTVGPATVATLLLLATQFPIYYVLISFLLNMAIVWIVFAVSNQIVRFLGQGGIKAFSRVSALLLAAIAVSMIINGLRLLNIVPAA